MNRTRRATGEPLLIHKRIVRLMKQGNLLLQRHTGERPVRAHEGRVVALGSNQRWSSDVLEVACWNGEVVRVTFAIDMHDREVIAWVASTSGISGRVVGDLMLACVEARFQSLRAPHPVQWLADNGSAYTAAETLSFAAALGLVPCFTPVRSPESNGVSGLRKDAEARLRSRAAPPQRRYRSRAPTRLNADYNHHQDWECAHPREFIRAQTLPASCLV